MVAVKACSFVFVSVSIALMAACSGASSPEIPLSSQSATDPNDPSGTASSSSSSSSSGGGNVVHSAPEAGAAPPPANNPPGAPACAVEAEPNGSVDDATTFSSCISGTLANAEDTDYLRIVATGATMVIQHTETKGKVLYRVSREGVPLNFGTSFTDAPPVMPTTPGGAYLFRVTVPGEKEGKGNGERTYELRVTFQ